MHNFQYNGVLIEREIRAAVEGRLAEIVEQLSNGTGISSMEDYRNMVGYVSAFREVLEIVDDVRARIVKKEGK